MLDQEHLHIVEQDRSRKRRATNPVSYVRPLVREIIDFPHRSVSDVMEVWKDTFCNSKQCFCVMNKRGGFGPGYVSPSVTFILGYTQEEYLRMSPLEMMSKEDVKIAMDFATAYRERNLTQAIHIHQHPLLHANGKKVNMMGIVRFYYDGIMAIMIPVNNPPTSKNGSDCDSASSIDPSIKYMEKLSKELSVPFNVIQEATVMSVKLGIPKGQRNLFELIESAVLDIKEKINASKKRIIDKENRRKAIDMKVQKGNKAEWYFKMDPRSPRNVGPLKW
eukprot:CAMPEP_0167760462 /NCGR_PEP_ID=MMETSP0110_2-20121227/11603_1 /TAXON_ID=629695 /ORGANISM="Gymnochlora sp., Strain CCMP2014" /LENGTH=276 /DNA_ID=CAMNT_0007646983 /DNA_START=168 /DNA_END=995 /DNA_ORIENTATION=-